MSTQEILDELRPKMCPIESSFVDTMKMFELFLPVNLPPDLHNQGFKFAHFLFSYFFCYMRRFRLWLPEFFDIWESISNQSGWVLVSLLIKQLCLLQPMI
jgi:hypothetical protein